VQERLDVGTAEPGRILSPIVATGAEGRGQAHHRAGNLIGRAPAFPGAAADHERPSPPASASAGVSTSAARHCGLSFCATTGNGHYPTAAAGIDKFTQVAVTALDRARGHRGCHRCRGARTQCSSSRSRRGPAGVRKAPPPRPAEPARGARLRPHSPASPSATPSHKPRADRLLELHPARNLVAATWTAGRRTDGCEGALPDELIESGETLRPAGGDDRCGVATATFGADSVALERGRPATTAAGFQPGVPAGDLGLAATQVPSVGLRSPAAPSRQAAERLVVLC
jgi:hypothetical protein